MTHQLDTIMILEKAHKRKDRVAEWNTVPEMVKKIASHIGILPPLSPSHICRIIEKSLTFNAFNGLISLERHGCTVRYDQLTPHIQNIIIHTLKNSQNGMEKMLRAIITNIPD